MKTMCALSLATVVAVSLLGCGLDDGTRAPTLGVEPDAPSPLDTPEPATLTEPLRLYDAPEGRRSHTVGFSPDGSKFAYLVDSAFIEGDYVGELRVVEVRTGVVSVVASTAVLGKHHPARWAANGATLVYGSRRMKAIDPGLEVLQSWPAWWRGGEGEALGTTERGSYWPSPDGRFVVRASFEGDEVHADVVDLDSGEVRSLPGHPERVYPDGQSWLAGDLDFGPQGRQVVYRDETGRWGYDLLTGATTALPEPGPIASSDHLGLRVVMPDGTSHALDAALVGGSPSRIQVGPRGRYVAYIADAAGSRGRLMVWELESGAVWQVDDDARSGKLRFTEDGARLLYVRHIPSDDPLFTFDNELRVWDLATAQSELVDFPVCLVSGGLDQLGVSANGRWLFYQAADLNDPQGTCHPNIFEPEPSLRAWDLQEGVRVAMAGEVHKLGVPYTLSGDAVYYAADGQLWRWRPGDSAEALTGADGLVWTTEGDRGVPFEVGLDETIELRIWRPATDDARVMGSTTRYGQVTMSKTHAAWYGPSAFADTWELWIAPYAELSD